MKTCLSIRFPVLASVASVVAFILALSPTAQAAITFDDFNVNEGHFNLAPNFSGSTANIAASSTAVRVTTDGPLEGVGHERLVLDATAAGTAIRCRFLSGSGSVGSNIPFTTSAGTDGWIGLYIKADPSTDPNWTVQLWIEGGGSGLPQATTNNGSVPKTIIADGTWHLYEWDLDDTSGGADGWGNISGVLNGNTTVVDGSHTIDSVLFRNASGPASSTLYMDFVALNSNGSVSNLLADPCLATSGVVPIGPVSTVSTQLTVSGVSAGATAVTIYQNSGPGSSMVSIGSKTSDITEGNNDVVVSGLVKTAQVVATQTVGGQESCIPAASAGITVGGGANPRLRIAASVRQPGGLTGPIGANGGGPVASIYWIHASGASVAGGTVLQPSTNWQTVIFYPTDSKFIWNAGTVTLPDPNQFGILEGFGLAIDDLTDTGPYAIYVDNLRNSTTVIQDFENETPGTEVQFPKPGNSGTTSGNILTTPDSSFVSSNFAAAGTNSALIQWQFNGTNASKWVRLNALSSGGTEPTPNPQVDLTQPIAIDVLLLPVNQAAAHSIGLVSLMENRTNCIGDNVTFNVAVIPPLNTSPTYTYQWKFKNVDIAGATTSTFTTNGITTASAGSYSVAVSDGIYTVTPAASLTVPAGVVIDTQPGDSSLVAGDGTGTAYFSVNASVPDTCPCANSPALTYQWYLGGSPVVGATDSFYSLNNVWMTNGGNYTVLVSNTCNQATLLSAPAKLYVYDPAVTPITANCSGSSGLLGLYWTNQTAANAFTGIPTWTNNDWNLDFDWVAGGPAFDIYEPTNNFATRWIGTLQPYYPNQTYTFYTRSDDGVRLWVDGKLLIDKWFAQSATEWSGSIALGANPVNVIVEYFEQTGDASVKLFYDSVSVTKQIIPNSQICAADPATGIPPVLRLTSPANNATVPSGNPVTLTADVTASSATVNKVEFYNHGTVLIDTVNAPGPYTKSWMPSGAGIYSLSARVYYNSTNTLNSPANQLTVSAPSLGAVNITGISSRSLSYAGGAGAQFVLLRSPIVNSPLTAWTRVATNPVTPGTFNLPSVQSPGFYSIKSE